MVFYALPTGNTEFQHLEQVHVRGLIRRSLRLQLIAGMSFVPVLSVLAMPAPVAAEQGAPLIATQTTLTTEMHDRAGRTQATLDVDVAGEDRAPASGAVSIADNGRSLAGAGLNAQGHAKIVLDLPAGAHEFTATYRGDAVHGASVSQSVRAQADGSTTPDFQISVVPATLSLTPGQSGSVTASVTPENSAALTAPMFVTLSCSGLPDESSCVFTPENVEIVPNATAAITSSLVIVTQDEAALKPLPGNGSSVNLAILLPGALGLGCLAWSVRNRPWLQRLSLMALIGLVGLMGTTACNARYNYYHHGPPPNPPTPAGTYTVEVTAQSSDGVTATTHSTTLAFTVK
jgi:hypothetical protein